ncbi:unnamed protein product [Brassicogethes aeneus]|uniref:PPIase cyclophilin-type domain-containing protein n=1 Tax=Brassicogethes aeneus TaxID=1431903 RepID=A0A9P0FM91_BRAAE|nr:unnamed protein product [Brassicogethes aeneus]
MNTRKEKKFRPNKIPRFLPSKATQQPALRDLEAYNEHRYRVFTALPKIDDQPCKFKVADYLKSRKAYDDARRQQTIDKENKAILKKIVHINRTGGLVDCFYYKACMYNSNIEELNNSYEKIRKHNLKLYNNLLKAKSTYEKENMDNLWKKVYHQIEHNCKYDLVIFKKESEDNKLKLYPSLTQNLNIELSTENSKQYCYLDFSEKNGRKIGRVYIQLYSNIVPKTVQNFYEMCSGQNEFGYTYKNALVYRIKKGHYMETGDITYNNSRGGVSIYGKRFREENHELKHSRPGVLSMVRVGKRSNNSKFVITFAPMEILDKKNVVFGSIYKGMKVLKIIQGYARKIGKPMADIIISDCNVINKQ